MLRWYPRRWRQQHGDAILGLHLDRAVEDRSTAEPLSRRDRAAMRAAGLFERTRHGLPIATAAAGLLATVAGMVLSTLGASTVGPLLWILAGPALLCVSFWGLVAAHAGRWGASTVISTSASVMSTFALVGMFWMGVLRDDAGPRPGLEAFWGMAAIYMAFVGIAVAIATSPGLVRGGIRRDWALTVGFAAGFVGAVPLAICLLTGVAAIIVGVCLIVYAVRGARLARASHRPLNA